MPSSREETTEDAHNHHQIRDGEIRHSNPFLAEGVLSKKADYIITHSTITRTELHIADPDAIREEEEEEQKEEEKEREAMVTSCKIGNTTAEAASPVEVEVRQTTVTAPGRQKAEEVQLKKHKRCKCCTVQ